VNGNVMLMKDLQHARMRDTTCESASKRKSDSDWRSRGDRWKAGRHSLTLTVLERRKPGESLPSFPLRGISPLAGNSRSPTSHLTKKLDTEGRGRFRGAKYLLDSRGALVEPFSAANDGASRAVVLPAGCADVHLDVHLAHVAEVFDRRSEIPPSQDR
jgi:hypothetical protein